MMRLQSIQSELDQIKGIGPATKETLLKEFKSIAKIKQAGEVQVAELIGKAKAKTLFTGFDELNDRK
jgi:excinuclease ABC subunit C